MKKLLGIVVLGLLVSLVTSQAISAGCKIPKKPKEKIIEAPEAVLKKQKTPTTRLEKVLANRRTINVFRAYAYHKRSSPNKYGLNWSQTPILPGPSNLSLMGIDWNYHYSNEPGALYPGLEPFITKKKWGHSAAYGKTVWVKYSHPEFADYFSNLVLEKAHGFDGVHLDWWHNNHETSKIKVKMARRKIAGAIRNKMGEEFIILGNVNWEGSRDTHDLINGVNMELNKKHRGGYSCNQISKIEKLIKFHDQNLSEPRIIAVDVWRITKKVPKELQKKLTLELMGDERVMPKNFWKIRYRSSPENIQLAKLYTAMTMVIPENGYILYADNNPDNPSGDHDHTYYDFYNTDLGKAISDGVEITDGLAYKKYEKGLIAYNRTKFKYTIKFKDGKKVEVGPLEGVFVKD